ncbi:ankyrin repeat and MYND domain-containing protein 1-like [Ostrinia nubilalis]|uniref:ankyrin repeat and MYND domain-containing protein 1-like n=1 Tax=Ostrinia nubilalis TaxID=29057 RepID=UPI00308229CA
MQQQSVCPSIGTKANKIWPYDEYYCGDKDEMERKNGNGNIHWTGAKSLEWYSGCITRDVMHGPGEYRWRHGGDVGAHHTYEGRFHCNRMHGYGTMSYPDGRVFTGLFHSNMRWGPGIESHACLKADVGLWRGTQLVRLVWRPETPSIAPDLYATAAGRACVDPHRVMMITTYRNIGETNSALDLLKQYGSDPRVAADMWDKLYPQNCTDLSSILCHVEYFENEYYKGRINMLQEVSSIPEYKEDVSHDSVESQQNFTTYFAWNNNQVTIHMMKHSYTHDYQRDETEINLTEVLCGPRKQFKPAGQHELDCRTLLMASYLGHTKNVVQLVNQGNIHPDIADSLGNSAVMYATCGDRAELIHFLVEAGANVNSYNDSCCTPLAVALIRFICAQKDISFSGMVQALLPPPVIPAPPPVEQKVFEWNFSRDQTVIFGGVGGTLTRTPSKVSKALTATKKVKSSHSLQALGNVRKKTDTTMSKPPVILEHASQESFSEEKRIYTNINNEFMTRVNDLFLRPSGISPIPYLFEVIDMVQEVEAGEEDPKKPPDKNPKKNLSKVLKDTMKPSKEMMWQSTDKDEFSSVDSIEKLKSEMIANIRLTIIQLLEDGANPNLVRCPKPALFLAIIAGSPELVKHLVDHGADINEVYKDTFGYTPLDLAVSRQFTYDNLEMIKVVLECGATTFHRLRYGEFFSTDSVLPEPCGPNLLHAVLARKTEGESEEEIRHNILEHLLEYYCNPLLQFKGRSPIDIAMTKSMDLLDIFIRSPTTKLNALINDSNQTVLVKMFSLPFFKTVVPSERLQTLTNLLLFGADPLIECMNGSDIYPNIFVFAMKTLGELESSQSKPAVASPNKDAKKVAEKPKKETLSTKSLGKLGMDDVGDYKQAIDLVTECARLLHVRWLQAKLMKELVEIIDKYKHRQWNIIIREHKRKKSAGLWLTTQRCLEIWDILKLTKRKMYNDNRILKHLLYIIQYYNRLEKIVPSVHPTAEEKSSIECNINYLLKERMVATKLTDVDMTWKRPYVKPELTPRSDEDKFNICFECALPFIEEKIQCVSCKLVSFCSFDCMRLNIDRANCHPCSIYLKNKYFPSPPESGTQDIF